MKISSIKDLQNMFIKTCINGYSATEIRDGKVVPRLYRREDLSQWAGNAFSKGEHYFYCEPVNPENPNGKLRLCEPKYEYRLKLTLSETEYDEFVEMIDGLEPSKKEEFLDKELSIRENELE